MNFIRPTVSPPRQPYALAPARGFSLLEVMVGLGLVTLLAGGVYTVAKPARLASQVSGEVARLADLRRSIPGAYAAAPDFQGLSNSDPSASAAADPTPWGSLTVQPVDFKSTGDGWSAKYAGVPDDACAQFSSRELNRWAAVLVDDRALSGVVDAVQFCGGDRPHTVEFRDYAGPRREALASALPPLGAAAVKPPPATPMPIPPPGSPPVYAPPPGPGYTDKPTAPPPPTSTPVTVVPPAYTPPTATPPPKPVYPPACSAPASTSTTENQPASCPSGEVTSSGAGSFVQSRTKTITYSCPDKYGPVASSVSYSPWSPTASSVCAPPPPTTPVPGSTEIAYAGTNGIDIRQVSGATSYEMGLSCLPNDVSKPLGYTQTTVPASVLHPSPNTMDTFSGAQQIGGFYTSDPGEPQVVSMYNSLPESACQAPGYMTSMSIQVFVRACNSSGCSAWSQPVTSFCSWNHC